MARPKDTSARLMSKHKEFEQRVLALFGNHITLLSEYTGSGDHIKFECKNGHTHSAQARSILVSQNGCAKCGQESVIKRGNEGKFNKGKREFEEKVYSVLGKQAQIITPYIGAKSPITIQCANGHVINFTLAQEFKYGCRVCNLKNTIASRHDEYVERINSLFGGRIEVLGKYKGSYAAIMHKCKIHGLFQFKPQDMLNSNKYGCIQCGQKARSDANRLSHNQVVNRINKRHKNLVSLISKYTHSLALHKFKCNICSKTWNATADSVMRISGCPHCNCPLASSRVSVDWIKKVEKIIGLEFMHAENGGECRLYGKSGKKYWVDGYNHKHKLVLEFHGDLWHGNPVKYASDFVCNPWTRKTASELYSETRFRENDLAKAGYQVVTIWESDFKLGHLFTEIVGHIRIDFSVYL